MELDKFLAKTSFNYNGEKQKYREWGVRRKIKKGIC